jgi:hypothetical protein
MTGKDLPLDHFGGLSENTQSKSFVPATSRLQYTHGGQLLIV